MQCNKKKPDLKYWVSHHDEITKFFLFEMRRQNNFYDVFIFYIALIMFKAKKKKNLMTTKIIKI